ncbi:MAG: PVC-type heme-binding CxxCH protein [Bacteroidota bacterium]
MRYLVFSLLGLLFACQSQLEQPFIDYDSLSEEEKLSAENALASMELYDGLEMQLFASEPMMSNPTNMDIDAQGRIWMIEGQNYRNQHNPDNPYRNTGDRILILEDTDGDGKADSKKVFYEGEDINSALGIAVLGEKIYVSHSPQILVFTDSDGDDQPDSKEVLFQKMDGDQHDHGIHAITFGMDGRLYFNTGNEFEKIADKDGNYIKDRSGKLIDTKGGFFRQGLAFRCELDGSDLEVLGHNFRNPYELAVDSYGTLWQSDNDDDGNRGTRINYVMPYGNYGYTNEMTGAGWRTRRIGMHDSIPLRHWHQNDPGSVPNLLQTGSGSPTGMTIYEANLLPKVFHNQMIHCEPGHQVVRAYPVAKDGAGYTAKVINIMKSKDPWFRPSDVTIAPDGSIFVADWYDPGVGGHKMGDLEKGRIYRIAPKEKSEYRVAAVNLSNPKAAIEALKNPNLATRYLAWQKLNEWGTEVEHNLLEEFINGSSRHQARAFWLLAHQNPQKYIREGLQSEDVDLQLAALRAADYLDRDNLLTYLEQAAQTDELALWREAAILLRYQSGDEAAQLWTNLAQKYDGEDRWYLEALGIGADLNAERFFETWLATVGEEWNSTANRDIVWRMRSPKTVAMIAEILEDQELKEEQLAHYFRSLDFQPEVDKDAYLVKLLEKGHPHQARMNEYVLANLSPTYDQKIPQARAIVQRILPSIAGTMAWLDAVKSMNLTDQSDALIEMALAHSDKDMQLEATKTWMATVSPQQLQKRYAAFDAKEKEVMTPLIGRAETAEGVAFLTDLMNDENLSAYERQLAATSLASSWNGQHALAKMIDENKVPALVQEAVALRLINSWSPKVKEAGFDILKELKGKGGAELPPIKELVAMEGNVTLGRSVFNAYCGSCHQVDGQGIEFGPNLSEIGSKLAKQAMYEAIFYPSAGINFGYEGYIIKTKSGGFYNGYISSETETDLTVKMMGGVSKTLSKKEIASKEPISQSLMTANLQAAMSEEDLVNLVTYLSSLKTKEKLSVK